MKYGILKSGDLVKFTREAKRKMPLNFQNGFLTDNVKQVDTLKLKEQFVTFTDTDSCDVYWVRKLYWWERLILWFVPKITLNT